MGSKCYPSMWPETALLLTIWLTGDLSQPGKVDASTQSSSPGCTGAPNFIDDGYCDQFNNNAECEWDGGDCCDCTCEDGPVYPCGSYFDCRDPAAWCRSATAGPTASPTPSASFNSTSTCTGSQVYIADGNCDTSNNIEACDYDGGDCCECTCKDGPVFTCGLPFDDCDDPLANCNYVVTSPSPRLGGNSENRPADRPTQASTPSATSSAVIALVCAICALTVSVTTLCIRSRRARRVGSGGNGGDDALAAVGAPSAVSSKSPIRGTRRKWIRRGGQSSAVVGRSPAHEARPVNIGPAATIPPPIQETSHGRKGPKAVASNGRAPPPPFEYATAGRVVESDIEAVNPADSKTSVPEDVFVLPSYEQALSNVAP